MLFPPNNSQRAVRMEQFRLVAASVPTGTAAQTATGCPEGFSRCTVLKNGTGDFTINFNTAFARTPVVTATALSTAGKTYTVLYSVSTTACRVLTYNDGGTATSPTDLHVHVTGFDTSEQV